ncbi:chromosome segregation protein SMC [Ammoniphilus resinae]|uniref:Chromosome partition protein Smc n=1 Tax=Ammoniphilus resinae TaxID=861532 RepID=A0ABS4GKI5_9BACL|nr:chromosome segregation protein SMC [Ammoniphilus resinae]MBP1930756.1 chromosome segregation protein [Ammoniphilus resinae]
MYLKRLELMGFKSFANRTELEFVPGVTAVVGPNGSGKSNISDSIRWVLGEQSAKTLRGSKMEDIIFAGSDTRKPVNYCEVALTLDNSDHTLKIDYTEVTIARRVYRSGESEYFINKRTCRLRDIIELFMDTGVGKEAYSIIGQGRIEEILSTKSDDRRGIFEEASGIVKYKARKKEAEKKIDETEANLVRIADIISEITGQLKPLQEQAEKASLYLVLKEDLKQQEVGLFLYHIERLHTAWNLSKEQLFQYKSQHVSQTSELSAIDANLSSWRWKLSEQDQELENFQIKLLRVSEDVEKAEGKREVLRERKKNAHENHLQTLEKKSQLEARIKDLQAQLDLEETKGAKYDHELAVVKKQLKQQEQLLGQVSIGLATDGEQLKSEYIDLLNQISSAKNDLRYCTAAMETALLKKQQLSKQLAQQTESKENIDRHRTQIQQELNQITQDLNQCVEAYKELATNSREKTQRKDELTGIVRKLEQRAESLVSRKELLVEMQHEFTGFMQGVKEILKARDKGFTEIQGAVAELIEAPSELETAIEVALGGAMQHVVVDQESSARKAIQWLKVNKYGRATFLPLDVIRSRKIGTRDEETLQQVEGFVGIASDLVKTETKYQKIIENLLGSVVVMDSLEQANRAAGKTGYRYRFVTRDGDVVNPGGSMTGGSVQQKNTNLLGRSRQIEQLEEQIQLAKEKQDEAVQQWKLLEKEVEEILIEQDRLRLKGEELRVKEQEIKGRLNQSQTEFNNYLDRYRILEQELASTEEEWKKNEDKKNHYLALLQQWEAEESKLKQRISNFEAYRNELLGNKEIYTNEITELRVRAAEIAKQKEAVLSIIARVNEDLSTVQTEWESVQTYLQTLFELMEGNVENEDEIESRIIQLRKDKDKTLQGMESIKQARLQTMEKIEGLEGDSRLARKKVKELEDKLHQEELKANRFELELDNQLHKLREEYELSYDVAKEGFDKPENPKQTEEEVSSLKKRILELGSINVAAIEEYERQSERLDFLLSQSRDLEEAKRTLLQVIQEIEEEMSRRFLETFELIRKQFQEVFSHLFVGGRADLLLSDPENIFQTGIDIVAQPPGKKLQNLALLSGGEKALTAIALLFAILRVRPVPFCVLDEVEAALDDANVYRFAEYLREFSGQTQFICVTHRKGTMEGADVLYGVTMQEQGVSNLVSVKLEDKAALPALA